MDKYFLIQKEKFFQENPVKNVTNFRLIATQNVLIHWNLQTKNKHYDYILL